MEIILEREVFENFREVAKNSHPKEMFLFLNGKYDKKTDTIRIQGLTYQPYSASDYFALIRADIPLLHDVIGTVHSHPGPSNRPSNADLDTWKKYGVVHFILKQFYELDDLACYDSNGNLLRFSIN